MRRAVMKISLASRATQRVDSRIPVSNFTNGIASLYHGVLGVTTKIAATLR